VIGRTTWVFPGGFVPMDSTGSEPAFTSREQLAVLNAGDRDARVELWLHYEDREPVGPYRVTVAARRVRSVRFNDLIDPVAMPLLTPYAAVVTSDEPVVVQITRQDTGARERALMGTLAFPEKS
jgi:hypothetical protein